GDTGYAQPVVTKDGPLTGAKRLSARAGHTCAVVATDIVCWGEGAFLQLGERDPGDDDLALVVSGLPRMAAVAAGAWYTCGLSIDGDLLCWGANYFGERGDDDHEDRATPGPVMLMGPADFLSTGVSACARMKADGQLVCWGSNGFGALGNGETSTDVQSVPVALRPIMGSRR
ncbi:MAG: hypothetical protein OXR73_28185, partial [Myxococcales bacterium]|nr:hypothetical protein [Myxococcales bacterium]